MASLNVIFNVDKIIIKIKTIIITKIIITSTTNTCHIINHDFIVCDAYLLTLLSWLVAELMRSYLHNCNVNSINNGDNCYI
jgi:hypothetical protein